MILQYFFIGLFACVIAALPFGLVNLTVMETAINKTKLQARNIGFGAATVEIIFAALALYFSSFLKDYFLNNLLVNSLILMILTGATVFFFIRKQKEIKTRKNKHTEFIKGMLLNLISLQVFSFWIIASIYLLNEELINFQAITVLFFLFGVYLGKLLTLEGYVLVSTKVSNKMNGLPAKMNKIMGTIFAFLSISQFIKLIS